MKVSDTSRKTVFKRAFFLCEYCLIHQSNSYLPLQLEHILSQKHYVWHSLLNLASACYLCNRLKGSDIATILPPDFSLIRLYNPRNDVWLEHFELSGSLILPKTKIGQATVKVLKLNSDERVLERMLLIEENLFPHPNVHLLWEMHKS
jgi:HNH endonuclease